jgi:two-component system chemotaxis response regulator CheY
MYNLVMMQWRSKGTEIQFVFNGQQALERLAEHPDVEIILLDINMPVMNGIQFLEHCVNRNVHRHIPVIIISTEGKEQDTIRGLRAGAKAFLKKPFQAVDLLAAIEQVYEATRRPDVSPPLARPLNTGASRASMTA